MAAAEAVQEQVWGAPVCPKELLIPAQHEGGCLAGAFTATGALVGLVFSFPTRDPAVQHSHILATLEEWRGLGIGARLKWFQRAWCLERGVTRLRWTVDPLRAANAQLNLHHLGGTATTYYPDYYGPMQGIDAGAPTDRLLLEWLLDSQRVADRANRSLPDQGFPGAMPANRVENGHPVDPRLDLDGPLILIHIPDNYIALNKTNPPLALAWRYQTRELFTHYFSRGYVLTDFTRQGGPACLIEAKGTTYVGG